MAIINVNNIREEKDLPTDYNELAQLLLENKDEKNAFILRLQQNEIFWLKHYQGQPEVIQMHANRLAQRFMQLTNLTVRISKEEFPQLHRLKDEMEKLMKTANIHFTNIALN